MKQVFKTDSIFSLLVNEITNAINEEVIFTNEVGIIVASTDKSRIGNYHEGAYLSMKSQKVMVMTEQLSKRLQGVRKGIVLPIIIEGNPIGVVGITGDPKEVEPYGRIVQRMAELFIKEAIDQMTQERKALILEHFVFDWVNGDVDIDVLFERSKFLNIDITKYKQIISIHVELTNHISYKELSQLKRLWDDDQDALFVRWGQGKIIVVDVGCEQPVLERKIKNFINYSQSILGKDVYVGVGQKTNYDELHLSYQQAERAVLIARREKRVVFEEQLKFEMLQYSLDEKIKHQFISRTILPIIHDRTLIETLQCWMEHHMSIQETAKALFIHKNTLYYRLQKIEQETNLDLNRLDHVVMLYIALKFYLELEKNKLKLYDSSLHY